MNTVYLISGTYKKKREEIMKLLRGQTLKGL